jgi:UDP-N-acetylglucosamine 4,6-dehydratase/5-epimerase
MSGILEMKKNTKLNPKINSLLKNSTILVTGGAGSVGSVLVKKILEYPVKSLRVLDIDEHALFRLGRSVNDKRLRLLLGDILDKDRIELAGNDVDIIIHTAAIKNIEISEFNPIETIETNINGTVNLIKMAIKSKPKLFLNISTDKAAEPSTLYGTTKQLGERLTSWAGGHVTTTKFSTIRFGNIFETRGNVFEIWDDELKQKKPLSITDPLMNRYFFHVSEAVDFILNYLPSLKSGTIVIPKMKEYKMKDLASKISKNHKIIGIRFGEKLNEILITEDEKKKSTEKSNMWIIKQY